MQDIFASPWLFAVAGGALILGLAMAYGMMRARKRTRAEDAAGEAGARRVYREAERDRQP